MGSASSCGRAPIASRWGSATAERPPTGQRRTLRLFVHVGLPIFFGAASYALWRPNVLALSLLDVGRRPAPVVLPDAFLNHFADALWAYSVTAFVAIMWSDASLSSRRLWLGIALAAVLGLECMQLSSFVPGTFDVADLGVSITAYVCALFLTKARLGRGRGEPCVTV